MFLIMNLKAFIFFVVLIFSLTVCDSFSQDGSYKVRTVCIDAGHGGRDPGAVGKKIYEKTITLSVAKKLGALIQRNLKDVKVVYTRKTDIAVPLYKRAQIANKCKADLFISIHVNSVANSRVYGTESYALGIHRSKENLEVAMKENSVIKYEEDYKTKYAGFEPTKPESYIMFNMLQSQHLEQSLEFGDYVEKSFSKMGRKSRGVRQLGLVVLARTSMPAVLVELGFLTNPTELKFLKSRTGQDKLAKSIYTAFKKYKLEVERKYNIVKKEESIKVSESDALNSKKGNGVSYMVQIASSKTKMSFRNKKIKELGEIKELFLNGSYKYMIGEYKNFNSAISFLRKVKKVIKDSFIVAFNNGNRISVIEARKMTK